MEPEQARPAHTSLLLLLLLLSRSACWYFNRPLPKYQVLADDTQSVLKRFSTHPGTRHRDRPLVQQRDLARRGRGNGSKSAQTSPT